MEGTETRTTSADREQHKGFAFSEAQWNDLARSLDLSPRELQIVQRIFLECKEEFIARELGISPHTVHTHLDRLYRKLGVSSRCGVVLRVFAEYLALGDPAQPTPQP